MQSPQLVVDRVRAFDEGQDFVGPAQSGTRVPLTESEIATVRALEWLLVDPALRLEAIRQCNAVLRKFLGEERGRRWNVAQGLEG